MRLALNERILVGMFVLYVLCACYARCVSRYSSAMATEFVTYDNGVNPSSKNQHGGPIRKELCAVKFVSWYTNRFAFHVVLLLPAK